MGHTISSGVKDTELGDWLKRAAKRYGTFADGRVNYGKADLAPIVMCTLLCEDKILLVKRGQQVGDAKGYWSVITGFIDELKPITEQARQEIMEELGVRIKTDQIRVGTSYTLSNSEERRNYIVFPCLVSLPFKLDVTLSSEHTDFAWVLRSQIESYHILSDLPYAIDAAINA